MENEREKGRRNEEKCISNTFNSCSCLSRITLIFDCNFQVRGKRERKRRKERERKRGKSIREKKEFFPLDPLEVMGRE